MDKPAGAVTVAGHLNRSLADFERACLVLLGDEQRRANPDNALIALLCDAVRLARESKTSNLPAEAGAVQPPETPKVENPLPAKGCIHCRPNRQCEYHKTSNNPPALHGEAPTGPKEPEDLRERGLFVCCSEGIVCSVDEDGCCTFCGSDALPADTQATTALREEIARLREQLLGMTGERDDEREIARGWGQKAEAVREENARLTAENEQAHGYLSRLFLDIAPECHALPNLLGVCSQVDNAICGFKDDRGLLEKAEASLAALRTAIEGLRDDVKARAKTCRDLAEATPDDELRSATDSTAATWELARDLLTALLTTGQETPR